MYICICNAVTESDIRQSVAEGVQSIEALRLQTGCATGCGTCTELASQVLHEALAERPPQLHILAQASAA